MPDGFYLSLAPDCWLEEASKTWAPPLPTCGDEGGVSFMPSALGGEPMVSSNSMEVGPWPPGMASVPTLTSLTNGMNT